MREGEEVWSAEHPFTFWDAVVTEDGTSIGYAYPLGIHGSSNREGFTVAIFDVAGRVRARHDWKRGRYGSEGPWRPTATGLFLDADPTRFVLRVQEETTPRSSETWWRFRVSDGEEAGKLSPELALNASREGVELQAARVLPGTPLVLVHGLRLDGSTVFALLDELGSAVWLREAAEDGGMPAGDSARERMRRWARDGRAIATQDVPGRFQIQGATRGVRSRFEASRDPQSEHGWRIRELEVESAPIDFEKPAGPILPRVALREVARAVLGSDAIVVDGLTDGATPRLIHDLFADRAGRILALDRTWKLLQVFDLQGSEIDRGRFDPADELKLGLWSPFAEAEEGQILVRVQGGEYVRFDRHARRLGREKPGSEVRSVACVFRPGSAQRWVLSGFGQEIVDGGKGPDSPEVRPTIRRRPDGRWLRHVLTLLAAEDGTLFAHDGSSQFDVETPSALCIYPADGSAGRTCELPGNVRGRLVAAGPAWLVIAFGDDVFLIERGSERILRAEFDAPKAALSAITWLGAPDGCEVWRIERTSRTLVRYALP